MKYFLISCDKRLEDGVVIDAVPENGPKSYKYKKLLPLNNLMPPKAAIHYSYNYPTAVKLYDFVDNTLNLLIFSEPVKKIIEGLQSEYMEMLPVIMLDHKEKEVKGAKYFIFNYFQDIDFFDFEKSAAKMNPMKKEVIFEVKGDVFIKKDKIPDGVHVFRAKNWPNQHLVSEKFVEEVKKKNLSGYEFVEVFYS